MTEEIGQDQAQHSTPSSSAEAADESATGLVFDVQRFSIHDGPGIRTTVFLQGCNLRCFWCHNPESVTPRPQVQFFRDKCIACGACVEACPRGAQVLLDHQRIYLRDICESCGRCADACFARALVVKGQALSVEQVIAQVDEDRPYYEASGGGVTFSGGEPLLQLEFLSECLRAARQRGLHTAVDTAANVPWAVFEELLPLADLFLVDLKALDGEKHRRGTGSGNARILENLRRLGDDRAEVWVRVPIIPGFNDDPSELGSIADFLADLRGVRRVELLPFHHLGAGKYESLGAEYRTRDLKPPTEARMAELAGILARQGLDVRTGL